MPVILHSGDFDRWLSRHDPERPPVDLLRPFPADEMESFEVSADVGKLCHRGLRDFSSFCIERRTLADVGGRLGGFFGPAFVIGPLPRGGFCSLLKSLFHG
jgi:hypothetical protein